MRAILLGPVRIPARRLQEIFDSLGERSFSNSILVAVDGGLDVWSKLGIRPHFAVGDWDSLRDKKRGLKQVPHLSLSTSKDRSDLFYAVIAAIEAGATEVVCVGVTGGRLDHHLAMLYDLSEFSTGRYGKLLSVQARGGDGDTYFLSEKIPIWKGSLMKGQIISILGMKDGATGVSLEGFKYNLRNASMGLSSYGLSNIALKRTCRVSLKKGRLLVVIPNLLPNYGPSGGDLS